MSGPRRRFGDRLFDAPGVAQFRKASSVGLVAVFLGGTAIVALGIGLAILSGFLEEPAPALSFYISELVYGFIHDPTVGSVGRALAVLCILDALLLVGLLLAVEVLNRIDAFYVRTKTSA